MKPTRPENCTDSEWQEILASAEHENRVPEGMFFENGMLIIQQPGFATNISMGREYILQMLKERDDLQQEVSDLGRELNWRSTDRFLPGALKKLDDFYLAALKEGDRPRAEAYASAAGIFRGCLGDMVEHERRMNKR